MNKKSLEERVRILENKVKKLKELIEWYHTSFKSPRFNVGVRLLRDRKQVGIISRKRDRRRNMF